MYKKLSKMIGRKSENSGQSNVRTVKKALKLNENVMQNYF